MVASKASDQGSIPCEPANLRRGARADYWTSLEN